MKNRVTELLGVQYPIIGGAMQWLARAELVAATSNAGGMGILPAATFKSPADFKQEIRKCKELTDKPFAINITLLPSLRSLDMSGMIATAHEEGIKIIETAGRSPEAYLKQIRERDVVHMHKCARVRDAVSAERMGADLVTIVGTECAGHPSAEGVTTMAIVPKTVDSVKIPVLAGGGIADGRGFAAALALGAEGVVIGTRLIATKECILHEAFKNVVINADVTDTLLVLLSHKAPMRAYNNANARKVLEMETQGAVLEDILPLMSGLRGLAAYKEGDINAGMFPLGQSAGNIKEIKTVKEVIDDMVSGARRIYQQGSF